jgi:monofunctional glycosyltransferase
VVKSNRRRRTRVLLIAIVMLGLPCAALSMYWLLTLPDVAALARRNPGPTALMQARAKTFPTEGRQWQWMPLARISPHLVRAVVTAEDASFFQHEGFDWQGIEYAAWKNLRSRSLARGGSTITQQLAKNLYLSSDKSLLRKANEALITRLIEHHLAKPRILEIYLNVVEWGHGIYGAEAAARHHFNKSASELTRNEAALLAAILPAPRSYDPLRTTRYLAVRQQQILRWMDRTARIQLTER